MFDERALVEPGPQCYFPRRSGFDGGDWRAIFPLKIVGRTEDKRRNCTRIPNKITTFADGSCCKAVKYYKFQ
ncbi:hypothetical protein NC652_019400 [Populus alba x Populus x berolinensis]|nr:hypothetical protein NC652_019400 [Populus alba x Populus x berolinensis]